MKGITVVGCGVMGSSLISALMNGGYEVAIVDLNAEAAKPLVEKGAQYFSSLNEAKENETIIINLPNHKIAKKVVEGTDKTKLIGKMLINTTTSTPQEVIEMDKIAGSMGMAHLDAKIEVYPGDIGTENGYLVYSGNEEVFIKNKDALERLGKAVYLGSEVIGASVTDIAVLEVHFGVIATLAESAAYCLKNDYSIEKFIDSLRTILPIMMEGNLRAFSKELVPYTGKFDDASECTLNIETTAMETIVKSMNSVGVKTPMGDEIIALFKAGIASGNSKKNVVAVVNELI